MTSISPDYDVVVIGGGPAGSTTSTLIAQQGRRVGLFERERFPRFHIGESLLPYNREIFRELGVLETLQAECFPKKYGAQFFVANGSKSVKFVFANGMFTREKEAIQVERAKFDHILLKNARSSGVEVREGWTVTRFSDGDTQTQVEATDPEGKTHQFTGKL